MRRNRRRNSWKQDDSECPECGTINNPISASWSDVGYMPVECTDCLTLYWCRLYEEDEIEIDELKIICSHTELNTSTEIQEEIPKLPEGTEVLLIHRDHPYHLEPGIVIKRDHKHYRIRFRDGKVIWFPENLIEKIPDL